LSCLIQSEGLFHITGSHLHGKSGNILGTVQHIDVVTTDH